MFVPQPRCSWPEVEKLRPQSTLALLSSKRFQYKERAIDLEDLKQNVFGTHYQDESWHESLRLICGMIDAKFVGDIVEYLMSLRQSIYGIWMNTIILN